MTDIDYRHPLESHDPQRMIDYFTGRHDEREYAAGAVFLAGWLACEQAMAAMQRRAVAVVHAAAKRPMRTPEVLEATPEEMTRELADRDRLRAERFREACRQSRARMRLPAASEVA